MEKDIDGSKKFFAFIAYKDKESADKAIELNNIKPEENAEPIYVGFAESKKKRKEKFKKQTIPFDQQTNIYVKSIRSGLSQEEVKRVFEKFGKITSLNLQQNNLPPKYAPSETVQFCFINYETNAQAQEAFTQGKKDQEVLDIIHPLHSKHIDFIFFAQSKTLRM